MLIKRSVRSDLGLTLVEVLIALAIFVTVMAIAFGGILDSLTFQVRQESAVATQAKLRRVAEVVTQELRSAVFGSIIDDPYTSDSSSVSFMLLRGGAGYAISNYTRPTSQIDVIATNLNHLVNQQVLIADLQGRGFLTTVNAISTSSGQSRLTLACGVPHQHTSNTLLFEVDPLGIRFDEGASEMYITIGSDGEAPFAFDVAEFRVDFIYTAEGEEPEVRSAPYRVGGVPARRFEVSGATYDLARLQIVLGADAVTRNGTLRQNLTSQIELRTVQEAFDFALRELTTCI